MRTTAFEKSELWQISVRDLRSFEVLAETLNFTRAAERLYISQPALSRQIKALERRLGLKLFDRSSRTVRLSSAGGLILTNVRSLLMGIEEAARQALEVASRPGTFQLIHCLEATGIAAELMDDLHNSQAGVEVISHLVFNDDCEAERQHWRSRLDLRLLGATRSASPSLPMKW